MILYLFFVVFSLTGSNGSPAPGVLYAAAPEQRGAFHVGGKGVYNYGYNTGDGIAKVEVRNPDGSVSGSYRYFDPTGKQIVRSYVADDKGFRVLGNELPVAPDTPALGILNAQTLVAPVEGERDSAATVINVAPETVPTITTFADSVQRSNQQRDEETVVYQSLGGYFSNLADVAGLDSPYFYSDDNIHYDFPAGFAYNTPAVQYRIVYPVGVRGYESPSIVTAGHKTSQNQVFTVADSTRYTKPVYTYRRRHVTNRTPKRPYVIGHMK